MFSAFCQSVSVTELFICIFTGIVNLEIYCLGLFFTLLSAGGGIALVLFYFLLNNCHTMQTSGSHKAANAYSSCICDEH